MARTWKCFDRDRRIQLETLIKAGHTKKEIAALLGCHISTVYREVKRGQCVQMDSEWRTYTAYYADTAQDRAVKCRENCGCPLKYAADQDLMERIEALIMQERYSPAAVSAYLRSQGIQAPCEDTIYRYAHAKRFDRLRPSHLPEHGIRKYRSKETTPRKNKTHLGTSIEERPVSVLSRQQFGHWEMDCVIGKLEGQGQAMLVLTERMTRAELIFKLPRKDSDNVAQIVEHLTRRCSFRKIFKSITMDNGSEFAASRRMEFTPSGRRRTRCYYCHPYTSSERGSNENANRLIRRWFKKGRSLAAVDNADCLRVARWMNTYPRQLLGWKTAAQAFVEACAAENIYISPYLSQFLS